jgi:hypothetical protein
VRPGPINLFATGAALELLVVDIGKRLKALNYLGLGNISQQPVAANASRKWSNGIEKIKAADYFDCLFVSVL